MNFDSFSDSQMSSKIWLCEELEKVCLKKNFVAPRIWIYGSWHGILSFLILSRKKINPSEIRLFDLDAEALMVSQKIHNHWIQQGWPKLSFQQQDCNDLSPPDSSDLIIINTSCEHFTSLKWWQNIPSRCLFVIQSTDMPNEQHVSGVQSLLDWQGQLGQIEGLRYQGKKYTCYQTHSFFRFMMIGTKAAMAKSFLSPLTAWISKPTTELS